MTRPVPDCSYFAASDRKCVYAFGVDGKDGERFAFELGLDPKVTKYKTDAKVGDGFKEAQDVVRAIKPKAEKK